MAQNKVDIDAWVQDIDSKVPANLKEMYQKMVLSGMRIMFDKSSHAEALKSLEGDGPMEKKLSDGVIGITYILWQKSNATLPPQLIVPVTVVFVLRAYEFLEKSGDPEAQPAMLGEALALATTGIMSKFGANPDQLPDLVKQAQPAEPTPQKPQAAGLLAQEAV